MVKIVQNVDKDAMTHHELKTASAIAKEGSEDKHHDLATITKKIRVATVDEALEMTGYGKFNIKMIALTGIMSVALVLESVGFSYIIPASQCDLELNLEQKGIIAAIPFVCMIVTSHTWGYLADTKGRRACLAYSLSVGAIFSILSSFAPNLTSFIVLRIISALFTSGSNAIVYAYIGEFVPSKYLDVVISIMSSCIIFSTAAISVIAWIILPLQFRLPIEFLGIDYRPWRLMVLVFAIPSAVCAVFLFISYETPKFLVGKGRSEESLRVLRAMFAQNTGRPKSELAVDVVVKNKNDVETNGDATFMQSLTEQTFPLFKPPLVKNLLKIFVVQFAVLANANGFYFWFPEITNRFVQGYGNVDMDGMNICSLISMNKTGTNMELTHNTTDVCDDSIQPGTYPFVIGLALIVGLYNIGVAFGLRYMGKRTMILINLGITSIIGLAINFIYDPIGGLVMLVIYNFCGTMMGVTNAFSVELFPTHLRGMAVCLALMVGRMGSVFGTNLIGYLIEFDCSVTFYLFSGLICAAFVVACFLPKKKTE